MSKFTPIQQVTNIQLEFTEREAGILLDVLQSYMDGEDRPWDITVPEWIRELQDLNITRYRF